MMWFECFLNALFPFHSDFESNYTSFMGVRNFGIFVVMLLSYKVYQCRIHFFA